MKRIHLQRNPSSFLNIVRISVILSAFLIKGGDTKLYIDNMRIPSPFILSSSADLGCSFAWDRTGKANGRHLYSIKWYKDNEEFYRYVPTENPVIVTFPRSGVFVEESRSNATVVFIRNIQWSTGGTYRCEVTADDFETVSQTKNAEVVAVPHTGPLIEGALPRYDLGDTVHLNCTSNSSDPKADLSWYINSESAHPTHTIHYSFVRERTNLMTTTMGLRFRLTAQFIQNPKLLTFSPNRISSTSAPSGSTSDKQKASSFFTMKVKCTAMVKTVYLKSNEISFKVRVPNSLLKSGGSLVPALESRDGKTALRQKSQDGVFHSSGYQLIPQYESSDTTSSDHTMRDSSNLQGQIHRRKKNPSDYFTGNTSTSLRAFPSQIVSLAAFVSIIVRARIHPWKTCENH